MKSSWLDCSWSKYTGGNWGLLLQSHRALICCRWDSQHQCSPGVSSQEKVSKCTMTLTGRKKKKKNKQEHSDFGCGLTFECWKDLLILQLLVQFEGKRTLYRWRIKTAAYPAQETGRQQERALLGNASEPKFPLREKGKNHKVLPWSHHRVWLLCAPKPTTVLLVSPWHIHKACSKPALLPLFPCFFLLWTWHQSIPNNRKIPRNACALQANTQVKAPSRSDQHLLHVSSSWHTQKAPFSPK